MEGLLDINVFMDHLEEKGLMIAPKNIVESRLADLAHEKLKKAALNKKALSFREIADAQLWGSISAKAVKMYAQKYAKPGEILETKKGKMMVKKIITIAVLRLSKSRGIKWD